jgi:RNA polymerase sigma factor (sigma-70 family)
MNTSPETRPSLLLRVKDRDNQAAWYEFVDIYQPLVYRLARGKGLQHADAEDLSQMVLMAVARSVEQWQIDPQRGTFRTWLHRVARNAILNSLTRGKPDRASGLSGILALLEQHPQAPSPDTDLLRLEYRREVFRWAARQIRDEFQAATWDAFWLTSVEGRSIEDVAAYLKKSAGAIYAARSRVMRRLREKADQYVEDTGF